MPHYSANPSSPSTNKKERVDDNSSNVPGYLAEPTITDKSRPRKA